MTKKSCKYYTFGALAYYWDVPRDLDTKATYRLRLTTNLSDDVDHLSGPFRLERAPSIHRGCLGDVWRSVWTSRMNLLGHLGVVAIGISLLVSGLLYFRKRQKAHTYERIAVGGGSVQVIITRSEIVKRLDQRV
jgi:hypothetical protein